MAVRTARRCFPAVPRAAFLAVTGRKAMFALLGGLLLLAGPPAHARSPAQDRMAQDPAWPGVAVWRVADLPDAVVALPPRAATRWVSGWSVALVPPRLSMAAAARAALPPPLRPPAGQPQPPDNATVRVIVPVAVAGTRVRLRLANPFATTALTIGAATVAPGSDPAALTPGTLRRVTFGGRGRISIPPGASVVSDPVALAVAPDSRVAVSLFFSGAVPRAAAVHAAPLGGIMTAGNSADRPLLPHADAVNEVWFLSGLDVGGGRQVGTVAIIGDSLSDGGPDRWSWLLGRRLRAAGMPFGIANQAVAGNRLTEAAPAEVASAGQAGVARLPRDVLSLPGLSDLIVLEGTNDIGLSTEDAAPVSAIIAGYRQIIAAAHDRGVRVFLATLPPFGAARYQGYYSARKENGRQVVNRWIRTAGEADGVIDFDAALRDLRRPDRLQPAFDAGDGLHVNDAGQKAMAAAVNLSLFR